MDGTDKELEIKVKKIIIHKRLHTLLQDIKKDYIQAQQQSAKDLLPHDTEQKPQEKEA